MERRDIRSMLRELSASAGGSLVNRTEKLQIGAHVSVLFIGLGGLGCQTLNEIKKIYQDEYEHTEYIRFLAVDSDYRCLDRITSGDSNGRIGQEELFPLWKTGDPGIQKMICNPPAEVRSWIGHLDVDVFHEYYGANIRQIGRILLCGGDKYSMLRSRIERLVSEIHSPDHPAHIVLIAGVSGSTGGGTFIDVSYMLREIEQNYAQNNPLSTWGVFFTPEVQHSIPEINGNPSRWNSMQANGYAALKELDYFMSNGTKAVGATEDLYTLDVPGGIHVRTAWPIYDEGHVFIVSAGDRVTECGEIVNNTAHALLSLFKNRTDFRGISDSRIPLSVYSNISRMIAAWREAHAGSPIPGREADPQGVHNTEFPVFMNYKYSSLGYSSVYLPRDEILAYCASEVLAKIFEQWKNVENLSQNNVDSILDHFNMGRLADFTDFVKKQMPCDDRLRIDRVNDAAMWPETRKLFFGLGRVRGTERTIRGAEEKALRVAKAYVYKSAETAKLLTQELEKFLETSTFLSKAGPFGAIAVLSGYEGIDGCVNRIDNMIHTDLPNAIGKLENAYKDKRQTMIMAAADREADRTPTDGEMEQFIIACFEYSKAYLEYLLYKDMLPELLAKIRKLLLDYNNRTFAIYVPVMETLAETLSEDAAFMLEGNHEVQVDGNETFSVDAFGLAAAEEKRDRFKELFKDYISLDRVEELAAAFADSMFADEKRRKIWENLQDDHAAFTDEIRRLFHDFFGPLVNDMLEKFAVLAYSDSSMTAGQLDAFWEAEDGTAKAALRDNAIARAAEKIAEMLSDTDILIQTEHPVIKREFSMDKKVMLIPGMNRLNAAIKQRLGNFVSYGDAAPESKPVISALSFMFPLALPLIKGCRNSAQVYFDDLPSSAGRHLDEASENWGRYLTELFGMDADVYYEEMGLPDKKATRTTCIGKNDSVVYEKIRNAVRSGLARGYILWNDSSRKYELISVEYEVEFYAACERVLRSDAEAPFRDCLRSQYAPCSISELCCGNPALMNLAQKAPDDPAEISNLCRIIRSNMSLIRKVLLEEARVSRTGSHTALEVYNMAKAAAADSDTESKI